MYPRLVELQFNRSFIYFWSNNQYRFYPESIYLCSDYEARISSKISGNSLQVPAVLLEELNFAKNQELELVEGKDEYLFYFRKEK